MTGLAQVHPQRRAGVALDGIAAHRHQWHRDNRRPRALTAREALIALEFEALFVCVAAGNIANGIDLTEQDLQRLQVAYQRIDAIVREAAA